MVSWQDFVRLMSTEFLLPVWPQKYMSSLRIRLPFFFVCFLAEFEHEMLEELWKTRKRIRIFDLSEKNVGEHLN